MQFRNVFSALALVAATFAQPYPISTVYQFENSFSGVGYVNIENVAVRSSNGNLLLNLVTGAIMAQLDPANPVPEVLVNISSLYDGAPGSLTGIAETGKDVYTVAAGNFVFGPQVPGGVAGVQGSFSVWNVDLGKYGAQASQVAAIPEAGLLNGVTALPSCKDVVLIADSALGAVWRVNVKSGSYEQIIQDPLLVPQGDNNFGVNGVYATDSYLLLTNSAQGFFGALPITSDGYPSGPVTPFAQAPNGTFFDDFDLDKEGNVWIATQPNAISQVMKEGTEAVIVAGGGDDMTLAGPTSCVFKGDILYIVTGGVGGGPMGPVSGGVYSIDTGKGGKGGKGRVIKRWNA